ncbi:MAG: cache domain-containing protein, partial [Paenibacillus sp.]
MGQRKALSIRQKLIITFVVILLVPSLIIAGTTYLTASNRIEHELMSSAQESVDTADTVVTNNIGNMISDLDYFAEQLGTESVDAELASGGSSVKERLEQYLVLHKDVLNLYVGTSKGGTLLGVDQELPPDFDPRTRDWYVLALKTPNAVVSPVYLSVDGSPVVSISKVLKDGQGVVALDLDLSGISKMTEMKVGEEGYILILDNAKKRVVNPAGGVGEEAKESYVASMFAGDGG